MNDIQVTTDGELVFAANGDFATVQGDAHIIQQIIYRLKTQKGDCIVEPSVGCNLEEFIGKPNILLTHTAIEQQILTELTRDFLLAFPVIDVVEQDENSVFILIRFPSIEGGVRELQVQGSLDLVTGKVFARAVV